jgi:PAS domain S-box-containing protein
VVTYRYPVPFSTEDYYISPQVEGLLGYPAASWSRPEFWASLLHPQDRDRSLGASQHSIQTGEPFSDEYRLRSRDGRWVWILDEATLAEDLGARRTFWQGVWVDISNLRRSQDALRESLGAQAQLSEERRRLLARLVEAQEEERRRLAGAIHDDPIQAMAAAAFLVDLLGRQAGEPEHREALHQAAKSLQEAIARLRRMVFELRPPALEREGLAAAIRQYAERATDATRRSICVDDRLKRDLPMELRTTAFRIVQEALSNVGRHSGASSVEVTLEAREMGLFARVVDDGIGFEPTPALFASRPGHLGLQIMRERAEAVGGWCEIASAPAQGTTIEFWLPFARTPP